MTDVDPTEFGRLQAHVSELREHKDRTIGTLERIDKSLQAIEVQLAEARGGWKTLLLVGGAAGAIGSGLTTFAVWFSQAWPK